MNLGRTESDHYTYTVREARLSLSLAENFRSNLSGGGGNGGGGSDLSRTRGFTLVSLALSLSLLARYTREIIIACNWEERTKLGVVLWEGNGTRDGG